MVFRLLEYEFESQKNESKDFYLCSSKAKLYTGSYHDPSQADRNKLFPQALFPSSRERENCEKSSFAQSLFCHIVDIALKSWIFNS